MSTPLGMPSFGAPFPLDPPATPAWRDAWDHALYGPDGFFRTQAPGDHFRTATHAPLVDVLAQAVVRLLRLTGLDSVVDVGAGRGELLLAVHRLAPDLRLTAVEVAARPAGLPDPIGWVATPPSFDGLLVAHEWLDSVPCHVVETDAQGRWRLVHVDPVTGVESLGVLVDDPAVSVSVSAWLDRWWPRVDRRPGQRAEVGSTRDAVWQQAVARVGSGLAIAVDYGHTAASRPPGGSLRSYRGGRAVPVVPDGTRDVTAHVAVDAVAATCGGRVLTQRDALHALGVGETGVADPLEALVQSASAAELTDPAGFGGFSWVVTGRGGVSWPAG